jgi:hypothetical protein
MQEVWVGSPGVWTARKPTAWAHPTALSLAGCVVVAVSCGLVREVRPWWL